MQQTYQRSSSYSLTNNTPPQVPSTPLSPSSATTAVPYSSLFGSTLPRAPRRPGTSSGSAAADGLLGPGPFGNGTFYTDPFLDDSSPSSPRSSFRRAFTLGLGLGGSGSGGGASEGTGNHLRKKSLGRKPSLGDLPSYYSRAHSPPPVSRFRSFRRRRANSSTNLRGDFGATPGIGGLLQQQPQQQQITPPRFDTGNPPAVPPEYVLSSSAPKQSNSSSSSGSRDQNNTSPRLWPRTTSASMDSARMVSRQGTMPPAGSLVAAGGMGMMPPSAMSMGMQTEAVVVHQHIQEMVNKRISTLEYLRKAHEGRVYWFNTLLFDKPDLARMTYFDTRRLARRATNYLLLGLSLPTVIDINATSPIEFLRTLNLLLTEFDAFQSLHPETGSGATSALGRARIANLNVFRRATPSGKSRRSSSANNDVLYEDGDPALTMPNGNGGGGDPFGNNNISSAGGGGGGGGGTTIMNGLGGSASVVNFGQSEADAMTGEEYVHLLTPSLPFDPDFFETFATLCDVLIDAYTRLLGLLPTPRECNASVAELFTKADAKVRKIIVQGIVKEFEDTSRNGVRTEVANVGKIVLGGLM